MKFRKDKDILRLLRVGLVVFLLGVVMLMFQAPSKTTFFIGFGLIFAGLFMFTISLYAATKPRTERVADERVTRINEKAGYIAGWLIMLSVTLMFWADKIWSLNLELEICTGQPCSSGYIHGLYSDGTTTGEVICYEKHGS